MDLQGVGEHDKNNNSQAADGRGSSSGIHVDDVSGDIIAIREVPCDACKDVQSTGGADGCKYN